MASKVHAQFLFNLTCRQPRNPGDHPSLKRTIRPPSVHRIPQKVGPLLPLLCVPVATSARQQDLSCVTLQLLCFPMTLVRVCVVQLYLVPCSFACSTTFIALCLLYMLYVSRIHAHRSFAWFAPVVSRMPLQNPKEKLLTMVTCL